MANHPPPKTSPLVAAITPDLFPLPDASTPATEVPTDDFLSPWRAYTQAVGVSVPGQLNRATRGIRGIAQLRR